MRLRYALLFLLLLAFATPQQAMSQTAPTQANRSTVELVEEVSRSVVGIASERPTHGATDAAKFGSGFVIDAEGGLVLTAEFNLRDGDNITVIDSAGTVRRAVIIASDEDFGLALLRVEGGFGHALSFASAAAQTGSEALAVGRVIDGRILFVGEGIVSVVFPPPDATLMLSFPYQRNMSGAPIVNANGEVIGIALVLHNRDTGALSPNGGAIASATLQFWLSTIERR